MGLAVRSRSSSSLAAFRALVTGCAIGAAAVVGIAVLPAAAAGASPGAPDLSGYRPVPVDAYLDDAAGGREVYFQTPDGLLCAIRPAVGSAGCDGALPAAPPGANEIVLSEALPDRGLHAVANPRFVKPSGGAAPVLPLGHKIAYQDFECAVADGPITMCTKGSPVTQWLVISPSGSGIGPAADALPDGFPDPNDFVLTEQSFVVGAGPKNMFPTFTVGDGLTCRIIIYKSGENEVFAKLPGGAGVRKTDSPTYRTPTYPGPVQQLPAGHRMAGNGATCMATADGGVACYVRTLAGEFAGFIVSDASVRTFDSQP